MEELDGWIRAAEKLLQYFDSARMGSRRAKGSEDQLLYVEQWIQNRASQLINSGGAPSLATRDSSAIIDHDIIVELPEGTAADFIQQIFPTDDCNDLQQKLEFRFTEFEIDLTAGVIVEMRKLAARKFEAKDYAAAGRTLQKILQKSEERFGEGFEWKGETLGMYAKVCWLSGRREEALKIFEQEFDGRAGVMETLAKESVRRRKWSWVEDILIKDFDGKEQILELVTESYVAKKKWNDANKSLNALLKYETDAGVQLQRMHDLAKVCLAQKKFDLAVEWCGKAVEGRQRTLGMRHHLFLESAFLLAQIYKAKGDRIEAHAYDAVLANLPSGLQGTTFEKRDSLKNVLKLNVWIFYSKTPNKPKSGLNR